MDWASWAFGFLSAGLLWLLHWWHGHESLTDPTRIAQEVLVALAAQPDQTVIDLGRMVEVATGKHVYSHALMMALADLQRQRRVSARWIQGEHGQQRVYSVREDAG